jgi:hypothetical protein
MSRLRPGKLHVRYLEGATADGPLDPRKYTLTHSDLTGELFLTIGPRHDRGQISGLYTRIMRDEVLASWETVEDQTKLHVYLHVSGGFALGPASWRESIFRRELPLVLEAIRYGDGRLIEGNAKLQRAPVIVHFKRGSEDSSENWGPLSRYQGESPGGQ